MNKSGAQIIIELLAREGIDCLPGIPGGANLPIYDALYHSQIRHILARHEQGAGFIAQGMARVSGQPRAFFATSGPGATNTITALADAKLDSIPVVCITGQVPRRMIGTDAFQEIDTFGMSLPATKHNFLVQSAADLLEIVPRAFCIARSGRPGPVLIDVPKDVQIETVDFAAWPASGQREPIEQPTADSLGRAVELIDQSQRPVLILGGGIIHAEAAAVALALAEKASLPAAMTLMGLGVMPADHPLALGMLGMHAAKYTNLVLDEADLIIEAGARFDDRATGKVSEFCPRAKVIHIDVDASEIGKIRRPDVALRANAAAVLPKLLERVAANQRSAWCRRVDELRRAHPLAGCEPGCPTFPYDIILETARQIGDQGIVTTDVGQHQMWVAQGYPFRRPRRWLTSGGLGTMGFGMPAAIGAWVAEPESPVVCFTGDGSLLMNIQELATAAELQANIKIILFDNNALGLVRQQQTLFYGGRLHASDFAGCPDFLGIAAAFGLSTFAVPNPAAFAQVFARALATPGPCLIHLPVDRCAMVLPMVPPGGANRDMILSNQA